MSGTRGYSNYRGRGGGWRAVLAVLLVLIILGAATVVYFQGHMVYDGQGSPRLELPWLKQEEEPSEGEEEPVDLVHQDPAPELTIEEPEEPEEPEPQWAKVQARLLQARPLTQASVTDGITLAGTDGALAVTVKDPDGVYFQTSSAVSGAVKTGRETAAALASLNSSGLYTIARFSCFHDPRTANNNVKKYGLRNTGNYIFYDGNNSQWLDPAKADARQYLITLAQEAAQLGFDEILLTDVSYPTVGKLNKIAYGDTPKEENLATFLQEIRTALEPYSVALSIEVPQAILTGEEDVSGLNTDVVAPWVDRIYVRATPEALETCEEKVLSLRDGSIVCVPEITQVPDPAPDRYLLLPS